MPELKEIQLTNEEIKELGYRLQAAAEVIEKFNEDGNENHRDVIKLATNEILNITPLLMFIDEKKEIDFLLNR